MSITIFGEEIKNATIDGQSVKEITIDGLVVWQLSSPEPTFPDGEGYIYNLGVYSDYWIEGFVTSSTSTIRTKEINDLTIQCISDAAWVTSIPINLTNYNTIYIDWEIGTPTTTERRTDLCSVSSLSGEYYIRVHAMNYTLRSDKGILIVSPTQMAASTVDIITSVNYSKLISPLAHNSVVKIYKVWLV
jgi:hypothetical protein